MNTKNTKLVVSAVLTLLLLRSVPGVISSSQEPQLRGIATSVFEEQVNEVAAIASDPPLNANEDKDYQDLSSRSWCSGMKRSRCAIKLVAVNGTWDGVVVDHGAIPLNVEA